MAISKKFQPWHEELARLRAANPLLEQKTIAELLNKDESTISSALKLDHVKNSIQKYNKTYFDKERQTDYSLRRKKIIDNSYKVIENVLDEDVLNSIDPEIAKYLIRKQVDVAIASLKGFGEFSETNVNKNIDMPNIIEVEEVEVSDNTEDKQTKKE